MEQSLISDPGSIDEVVEAEENKSKNKNSKNLSNCMITYTSNIKQTYKDKACPPVIDPDLNLFTGDFGSCPDVNNFYLKEVICVAPHLNFNKFRDKIKCSACSSVLHPKGWSKNIRNVHDLDGVCYAMFYNYT